MHLTTERERAVDLKQQAPSPVSGHPQIAFKEAVMTVMRYEPWNLVNRLHQDLDRMLNRDFSHGNDDSLGAVSDWMPAVDVHESKDAFVLRADLPGVEAKDIDVTMENGVLTLRGRRASEARKDEQGYRRIERVSGEFFRRFALPDTADPNSISAQINNGVLTVRIQKRAEVQPRRIEVRAADGTATVRSAETKSADVKSN
jgi:HSP20 family protein